MNLKYTFGSLLVVPLLPLLYFQGKQIKAQVPRLPEAKQTRGVAIFNTKINQPLKVLSIGESTMAGVGVSTHQEGIIGAFSTKLSQLLETNISWRVYAKSGYTVQKVHQKIIPKIEEKTVDIILIGLGGNDAFALQHPRIWRKHVTILIENIQAKFPKAIILFANMPPIKEFPAFTPAIQFTIGNLVEILGEELRKVVHNFDNVYYDSRIINLHDWVKKLPTNGTKNDFFSDGVHPSKLTYQLWGAELAKELVSFIK